MAKLRRIEGELVELGAETTSGPMRVRTAMAFRTASGGREALTQVHVPEPLRPRLAQGMRGAFYFTTLIGYREVGLSLFAIASESGTALDFSEIETLTGGRFVRILGYAATVLGLAMTAQVLWAGGRGLAVLPLPLLILGLGAFILWWIPSPGRLRAFVARDRAGAGAGHAAGGSGSTGDGRR